MRRGPGGRAASPSPAEVTGPLHFLPRSPLAHFHPFSDTNPAALRPVPPVSADPEALLLALQNLVKNAAEAIAGRGTVTVAVDRAEDSAIVSVTDTGPGMSEEFVRTSLFTPFRSTKDGGWGIGLFQARDIIERHGGTIAVTSTPGLGTTFRVRLPIADDEGTKVASRAAGEGAA